MNLQQVGTINGRLLTLIVVLTVTTVSAWITAYRMRRRIKKALGKRATDAELTSINTWMKVEEAEKRKPLG
jgi:hypothetical protein